MQAEQLLKQRRLDDALKALQDEVRSDPSDAKKRIFLFQLLCVLGQWDRAATQLKVAADLDATNALMAEMGKQALQCEAMREAVFAGERTPLIFGEPDPWVSWMVQANQMEARGERDGAASLREQALEQAPAISGTIDDQPFGWLADADARLGPMFEAFIEGRYYWIPLACVQAVELETPTDLRDLVWLPAQFTWTNQGQAVALMPVRYPGSPSSADDALRLAYATDWVEPVEGTLLGVGQRTLMTDQNYYPMLQSRRITFDVAPDATEAAEGAEGEAADG